MNRRVKTSAFTLIELIIVVTILAVVGGIALPVFKDMQTKAKDAATKGALGAMRAGVAVFRSDNLLQKGTDTLPILSEVEETATNTGSKIMIGPGDIPENPWHLAWTNGGLRTPTQANADKVEDAGAAGFGAVSDADAGWRYKPGTGELWANTKGSPSAGGPENNF